MEHVPGGEARVGRGLPLLHTRAVPAEDMNAGAGAELLPDGACRGGLGGLAGLHLVGQRPRGALPNRDVGSSWRIEGIGRRLWLGSTRRNRGLRKEHEDGGGMEKNIN